MDRPSLQCEDGKTYSGNITMQNARSLKLEGCVLGGLICQRTGLDTRWLNSNRAPPPI